MTEAVVSIYKTARHQSGMTRETAAEYLHMATDTLRRYENGYVTPPDDVVVAMCELYETPALACQHLREASELGRLVLPELDPCNLQTATIRLVNRVIAFADAHRDRQLLQIAEDGIISPEERPLFDTILTDLEQLVKACTEIKLAQEAQYEQA